MPTDDQLVQKRERDKARARRIRENDRAERCEWGLEETAYAPLPDPGFAAALADAGQGYTREFESMLGTDPSSWG